MNKPVELADLIALADKASEEIIGLFFDMKNYNSEIRNRRVGRENTAREDAAYDLVSKMYQLAFPMYEAVKDLEND